MIIETRVIFLRDLDVTIFYAWGTLRRGGDDKAIKKLRDFLEGRKSIIGF